MVRFGFIPLEGKELPVGFVIGKDTANIMSVGMTCSACHTRQIKVGNETYRIDGGPALANFEKYFNELGSTLKYNVSNPSKLEQFLDKIIESSKSVGDPAINDRNALRNKVIKFEQNYSLYNQKSLPNPDMWGVGRLDALNNIFNRVSGIDISPFPDSMILSNISPANAPVRFPFLWNMHLQDYTQWGGTTVNGNSNQALLRNSGECLGVGAQFRPVPDQSMPDGFNYLTINTLNFGGLVAIENVIKLMGPPKWPWSINSNLAAQGATLYADNCASCHGISQGEARPPVTSTWATPLFDVKTDNHYFNTLARTADPGVLNKILPPNIPIATLTKTLSTKILSQYQPSISFIQPNNSPGTGKFESRVLNGIWASAPYLHNGSVPTMEDLLKPANQRPTSFLVGVNFDTSKVGLSSSQLPQTGYQFNTQLIGNSNSGHEYGINLNAQQRAALLEYIKTL
jgi:cytochrome c553